MAMEQQDRLLADTLKGLDTEMSNVNKLADAWKDKHFVLGGCVTLPEGKKIESDNGPKCDRPKPDTVIGLEAK